MQDIFPRTEEVSDLATPAVKTLLKRDTIFLPRRLGVSYERALVQEDEDI